MDWFEKLTGFQEAGYEHTRNRFEVSPDRIRSKVNGQSYATGKLETPSLGELRQRARAASAEVAGPLTVSCVSGDVRTMHADPANENALFQVASQFNLLEMIGPTVTPEDGVTRYAGDRTQGPACAIAAGAATIHRNYFADVDGQRGQTKDRQIDCLRDLGTALGNDGERLWRMRNGYALCSEQGLAAIGHHLAEWSRARIDALRDSLRVGLHWDVEATETPVPRLRVSQALCSALPVSYTSVPTDKWQAFATLVLEGAYEATLWAAVLNAQRAASRIVFLTQLGGGAFGNDSAWIDGALRRALDVVRGVELDVRIVSHGATPAGLLRLAQDYRGAAQRASSIG